MDLSFVMRYKFVTRWRCTAVTFCDNHDNHHKSILDNSEVKIPFQLLFLFLVTIDTFKMAVGKSEDGYLADPGQFET